MIQTAPGTYHGSRAVWFNGRAAVGEPGTESQGGGEGG